MNFSLFTHLLEPLYARPALASFFCAVLYLICTEYPLYGLPALCTLLLSLFLFPGFQRKTTLAVLLLLGLRLLLGIFISENSEVKFNELPSKASGKTEFVLNRTEGVAVILKVKGIGKVRLSVKEPPYPAPGDSITFHARWYPVEPPTVPGSFDTQNWLKTQGFVAYGAIQSFQIIKSSWVPEKSFASFRQLLKNHFSKNLPPIETGLLMGLLAGDRSGIPDALQSDFRRVGIIHVLAISGFHVVLLSGMLLLLLKAMRLPHRIARILAILLMLLYVPVAGGSPAVCRAVFMFCTVQSGLLLERKADSLNSLGIALLILTMHSPSVIWDVGFELSAAATGGIIAYGKKNPMTAKSETLKKSKIWMFFESNILSAVWITVVATLSTAPFLIWYFHSLSPVSLFGNIFVVPLVSLGMQAGLFALLLPLPFISPYFCEAAGFLFRLSAFLVDKFSDFAGACITMGPFPIWVLVLLGVIILFLGAFKRDIFARKIILFAILILGGYYLYTQILNKEKPAWKVVVIDVGQGDCIFIKSPSGKNFLVDAGVNTGKRNVTDDKIIPFLRNEGVWKLSALIITHPDADHFGGAEALLGEFPVEKLWIQECSRIEPKQEWQRIIRESFERKIPVMDLKRGMIYSEQMKINPEETLHWEMRVLHPNPLHCKETNSQSITVRVAGIGGSILLTGDLTKEGEKEILETDIPLKTDVIKLGHHGSKTSSSREFLMAVDPKFSIVSSGKHNRFKHPSKQIVLRLDSLKIPMRNTAIEGSIQIDFDKQGWRASRTKDGTTF